MQVTLSVAMTRNGLPAFAAALERAAETAVAKTAHELLADAQSRAPIDTGNLRGSGYASADGRLTWRVGFTADYALYQELGTSRMRARPFLIPAWVAARYRLVNNLRRIGIS